MGIQFNVSFSVDQKPGTPETERITLEPSTVTSVNKTQSYTSLGIELTGNGFKTADLNTFKAVVDNPEIESVLVDSVSIVSDKKIKTTIRIYPKSTPETKSGCLSVLILLPVLGLIVYFFEQAV